MRSLKCLISCSVASIGSTEMIFRRKMTNEVISYYSNSYISSGELMCVVGVTTWNCRAVFKLSFGWCIHRECKYQQTVAGERRGWLCVLRVIYSDFQVVRSIVSVGSAVRNDIPYYRAGSFILSRSTFVFNELCDCNGMFGAIKGKATAVIGE